MVSEFGDNIKSIQAKLDYLKDLGINCIELMPITNAIEKVGWGYTPLGYFSVDDRFGDEDDFKILVDEAHQRGIAVILDAVYAHASDSHAYWYTYKQLGYTDNDSRPFFGSFSLTCGCGKDTDFNQKITQDFFHTVNYYWLDNFHIDGFRYDCTKSIYDGFVGKGYANLVYNTYQLVKSKKGLGDHWQRFFTNDEITVIQCAEHLEDPRIIDSAEIVLEKTYTNCVWQNTTMNSAAKSASKFYSQESQERKEYYENLASFGYSTGLMGFATHSEHNGEVIRKSAIVNIENHDEMRFLCNFGTTPEVRCPEDCEKKFGEVLFVHGRRELAFKVQPYLIGMIAAKGIPLLFQGQEIGEDYFLPYDKIGRVGMLRPVRWDRFYDSHGQYLIRLTRRLINIRRTTSQFRYGEHFYYNVTEEDRNNYLYKNVVVFSMSLGENNFSVITLNFNDSEITVPFKFPYSGHYIEQIDGNQEPIYIDADMDEKNITIPSNYGGIWTSVQ